MSAQILLIGPRGEGGDSSVGGEQEGSQAEAVGAEEAGVGGGEAGDDLGARMALVRSPESYGP